MPFTFGETFWLSVSPWARENWAVVPGLPGQSPDGGPADSSLDGEVPRGALC